MPRYRKDLERVVVNKYAPEGQQEMWNVGYFTHGTNTYLPVNYVKRLLGGVQMTTRPYFNLGQVVYPKEINVNHPKASAEQKELMPVLLQSIKDGNYKIKLQAGTAVGKTAIALNLIATYGLTALIVVDRTMLAEQWVTEIKTLLGYDAGYIGGGVDTSEGKHIVVAMVQTLARGRGNDEDIRLKPLNRFSMTVVDEADAMMSQVMQQCLACSTSAAWLFMSATFKRKDGLEVVIDDYHDAVMHDAGQTSLPVTIQPVIVSSKHYRATRRDIMLKQLVADETRLGKLIRLGIDAARRGRRVLFTSERIAALEKAEALLLERGVPKEDILVIHGKTALPKGAVPPHKYVLTTYSKFLRGISIEWLDVGINLTPATLFTQMLGRIRRPTANKKHPIWLFPLDKTVFMAGQHRRLAAFADDPSVRVLPTKLIP